MNDLHMGVAEVKRRFADVVGQVVHGGRRVIVERRGRPVVAIVPLGEMEEGMRPGPRLARAVGFGGADGDSFRELMRKVMRQRRRRMPRTAQRRTGDLGH
jgi:prevent-host-death family protein